MNILILGKGFIAQRCKDAWGGEAVMPGDKIYTKDDMLRLLDQHKPDVVLNAAGVTGRPNVDWCETHQAETVAGNTLLPIVVALACQERGTYLLHMGSGCIFYGDSPHPDKKWRENDFGNPIPVYSRAKWAADLVLSSLSNVGIARIRMPIDWAPNEQNLIDKLVKYPKIIDVTNLGTLKHRELIALYEELVDPAHTNEWIANEDLVKLGLATKGRSNNFLASENLEKLGITMRDVHVAIRDTMEKYAKKKLSAQGGSTLGGETGN